MVINELLVFVVFNGILDKINRSLLHYIHQGQNCDIYDRYYVAFAFVCKNVMCVI